MNYETIEDAYHFVSGAPPYEHTVVIHRATEEAFFASETSLGVRDRKRENALI